MGDFSRDPGLHLLEALARQYVAVRLQQGVPLLDTDWNELEDLRRYELQAFLGWFVGNGVPEGNDGFRVVGTGADNDFLIRGGDGTPFGAGRCLVEGLEVRNPADLLYSEQPLFGDPALAATLGVPPLEPIATPAADGQALAFLDVWEREVNAAEDDAHLLHPAIGVETCVRIRREWVVRVREGTALPAPGDADHVAGHQYYGLALLVRRAGDDSIDPTDVIDRRERQLMVPPATLSEDLFGTPAPDYRRGVGRPSINLREVMNALLRGDLPSTAAEPLAAGPPNNEASESIVEDDRALWAFFISTRNGSRDLFVRRYTHESRSWGADEALTTDPSDDHNPFVLRDSTGDIWLLWHADRGAATQNVWVKRYRATAAAWDAEEELISSPDLDLQPTLVEDASTNLRAFWTSRRDGGRFSIWTRLYTRAANSWSADVQLVNSPAPAFNQQPVAAVDASGTTFLLWESTRDGHLQVYAGRYNEGGALLGAETRVASTALAQQEPFILIDRHDTVHAFWRGRVADNTFQIHHARFNRTTNTWSVVAQFPMDGFNNFDPTAVEDAVGNLWLFWRAQRTGGQVLLYRIFNVATDTWAPERAVTSVPGNYGMRAVFSSTTGAVWALWNESVGATIHALYRQFFPVI
jgi:hypothetical protein